MTYVSYLRAIMRDLLDELGPDDLANLNRDHISHIGGGWKHKPRLSPEDVVPMIVSDYLVPPGVLA